MLFGHVVAHVIHVPGRQVETVMVGAGHADALADEPQHVIVGLAVPARPAAERHHEPERVPDPRQQQTALRSPRSDHQVRERDHRLGLVSSAHLRVQPPRGCVRSVERRPHLRGASGASRQRVDSRLSGLVAERVTAQTIRQRHHPRTIGVHDSADAALPTIAGTNISASRYVSDQFLSHVRCPELGVLLGPRRDDVTRLE